MWIDAEEGAFCVCESNGLWDHHMETATRFFCAGITFWRDTMTREYHVVQEYLLIPVL